MTVTIADQVAISDVDSNDVQTKYVAGTLAFDAVHSSGHGVSASQFTLDAATGTISYDKAAFDYLSGGETVLAKFTFNASSGPDTLTKTITLTINGQNDAPTVTVTDPAAVTEGNTGTPAPMTVTIADQVAISDVDSNDVQTKYVAGTLAFDAVHSSGHGVSASQFTLDAATGTISYDKAAFDYLSGGETVLAKFTFNASSGPDTLTKTITLTINGQNDAPTVTVTDPAAVTEGNTGTPAPMTVTIADQVAISDVDSNDVQTKYVAGTLAFDAVRSSGHGVSASQFTLDAATGTISYDKAAFDYLSGGETVLAKFTFNASSGPDTRPRPSP